jgi:hypothetical protein
MPWALAAAAAVSAVANYAQQSENNKNVQRQYNARNAARAQGAAVQDANAAKGQDLLKAATDKFQPAQTSAGLDAAITNRTNAINNNVTTPASINDPTSNANAPQVVQEDLASKMAAATAFGHQQAGALGRIGGTSDAMGNNGLALNDSAQRLGSLSNFAHGDAGVNRAQVEAAGNNARKAANPLWSIIGSLANAAGTAYTAGSGSGTGMAAGKAIGGQTGESLATSSLPAGQYGPVDVSSGVWS